MLTHLLSDEKCDVSLFSKKIIWLNFAKFGFKWQATFTMLSHFSLNKTLRSQVKLVLGN
jgi:hypothetical protein